MLIAGCALVVLSPLMGVLAVLIFVVEGRPVLFRQERAGRYGVPFTMYKFRTMNNARDENWLLLPDGERITRLGVG